MKTVLVDTNVILDIAIPNSVWREWSVSALSAIAETSLLLINPMIYAEVSVGFATAQEVDVLLDDSGFQKQNLPWAAAFLAGRAFKAYRSRGGERTSPLPDFFIGAHAAAMGHTLLTRDARRYRTYFPTVELVAPDTA
ncbi:type II toxin-antitoxin system VapC family toxin [Brevundimonas sp. AJA228-03]|uniref:type II toxin-antitoxin system VapC family toxin n=1 Tax=Brevundimonas sp. AJA228-03 TaxID=2752515 RepID=UPI001ADF2C03|nr:type II toxin-antitoxin system VapC family toxin [Brevundimonas sp. AJA228-03]QTN18200.1 type II toxin-antitoxin system VapC family toxin [Brevundimonas sp. AJA228-03]